MTVISDNEKTWDVIAESFDKTRKKPWEECISFIQKIPKVSNVVDLACGNGRHLIPAAKHCKKVIGVDISSELLKITKEKIKNEGLKNVFLIHSDVTSIPIDSNSVDYILFIAALHNIKGKENRIKALKEVKRILKKDGKALISVWSRWQDKFRKEFFKKYFKQISNLEFGDINIYWKQHGLNVPRFYHLYSKKEFVNDLKKAGLKIEELKGQKIKSKKYADNYFALVTKL